MERISVTVRLNGINLQFDEPAFARLQAYLKDAERTLERNPDRAEILGDLEHAVADQCMRRVPADRKLVTLAELEPALEEIGAVQDPGIAEPPPATATRRLEQISEGAVISGVCQGIARYLGVDVTLVRVIALVLLLVSGGTMIVVYLCMMLLLPFAAPQRGGEPVRRIPAKCREFVEALRSKLSTVAS